MWVNVWKKVWVLMTALGRVRFLLKVNRFQQSGYTFWFRVLDEYIENVLCQENRSGSYF